MTAPSGGVIIFGIVEGIPVGPETGTAPAERVEDEVAMIV